MFPFYYNCPTQWQSWSGAFSLTDRSLLRATFESVLNILFKAAERLYRHHQPLNWRNRLVKTDAEEPEQ